MTKNKSYPFVTPLSLYAMNTDFGTTSAKK